jgi:hypothetical protein
MDYQEKMVDTPILSKWDDIAIVLNWTVNLVNKHDTRY